MLISTMTEKEVAKNLRLANAAEQTESFQLGLENVLMERKRTLIDGFAVSARHISARCCSNGCTLTSALRCRAYDFELGWTDAGD